MKRLFLLLVITLTYLLPLNSSAQNAKTYIPDRAYQVIPTLKIEVEKFAPFIEKPWYFAGLVEQESCISLKHSRCWNTNSELRNNREHGLGLFQMTRAWDEKGKLRFDNLTYLAKKYRTHLGDVNWNNYKLRPDLQIRTGLLLWLEGYNSFPAITNTEERMKFTTSVYNGGLRDVKRARETCKLISGCDPTIWFNNVEKHLPKSKKPDSRYGGQSMYEINTKHVRNIFEIRMNKYAIFWKE